MVAVSSCETEWHGIMGAVQCSLAVMLALALPCHMQSTALRNKITDGQEHEHWESRQGSGAKLWFLRNQGSGPQRLRCEREG